MKKYKNLILFVIACVIGPASMQCLIASYAPFIPQGIFCISLWIDIQRAMDLMSGVNSVILPFFPLIPFLCILLSARIRRLNSKDNQAGRNLLFALALLMWFVPVLASISFLPVPLLWRYPSELFLWASSLTYCILLFYAYRLSVQRETTGRSRWAKWLALILTAIFLSACFLSLKGCIPLLLFPMAALILWTWIRLICEIYNPGQFQFRKTFGSWPARIGLVVVLVLLTFPISDTVPTFSPAEGWQPQHWEQFYLILGAFLLPYTIFAGLVPIFRAKRSDQFPPCRAYRCLGKMIFATYVIGMGFGSSQWFPFNLISFLIAALWIYPYLVERTTVWGFLRSVHAREELDRRPELIADLRQKQWDAKEEAKRKAKEGEREKRGGLPKAVKRFLRCMALKGEEEKEKRGGLPKDYYAWRAIFAFGPTKRPWENAKLSCLYGLILSTILFLVYSPLIFKRAGQLLNTPYPLLQILSVLVLPFFAKWLLAAFLLGYFFSYIRGSNGFQKGLVLAIGIVVCTLPINALLLSGKIGDPLALLWEAGQTILFLTTLGVWAFDFNTVRRYGLRWTDLLDMQGLWFLSPMAAAIGGAAISVITGKAETIMESVLELVLRRVVPFL